MTVSNINNNSSDSSSFSNEASKVQQTSYGFPLLTEDDKYDSTKREFLTRVKAYFSTLEWAILSTDTEGEEMLLDDLSIGRLYRNLCFWGAIGSVVPSFVLEAYNTGKLYVLKGATERQNNLGWTSVMKLPSFDISTQLASAETVIVTPDKLNKKEMEALMQSPGKTATMRSMMSSVLVECHPDTEQWNCYLHNLDAKSVVDAPGWAAVRASKYTALELKVSDEEFLYKESEVELLLRNHFTLGGKIPSRMLVFMLVLEFFLTSRNDIVLKGRRAHLSNVFVDDINLGVEHTALTQLVRGKVGCIKLKNDKSFYMPILLPSGSKELLEAAVIYEAAGISTYLNKSAKYLAIAEGANACGFTKIEDKTHSSCKADKVTKTLGRVLHAVATAAMYSLKESPIKFLLKSGEKVCWQGGEFRVLRIQSPIAEEGSGNGMGHPESNHTFYQPTKVRTNVPGTKRGEAATKAAIWTAPVGTLLQQGMTVIGVACPFTKGGIRPVQQWNSFADGVITAPAVTRWNALNKTMSVVVPCSAIEKGSAQKFRGLGKARALAYTRNVVITEQETGNIVFNPNAPLADNQVEFCMGDEEGKTLTQPLAMVAGLIGEAVFDCNTGDWQNKEVLEAGVAALAKKYSVHRWGIEPSVYQMFKRMYGTHKDFSFDDATCGIIHSNAIGWAGVTVDIVEVPLTMNFVGKTGYSGESINALAAEYPEFYKILSADRKKNAEMVREMLDMVEQSGYNPEDVMLLSDLETEVLTGPKYGFGTLAALADGTTLVENLFIPEVEADLEIMTMLQKLLAKANKKAFLFVGKDSSGDDYELVVTPGTLGRVSGDVSHNIFQAFMRVLGELQVSLDLRESDGWESNYYRSLRMLHGAIEGMTVDSTSLFEKLEKSSKLMFTCRSAGTIDGRVKRGEMHLNQKMADIFTVEDGDHSLSSRVPMPGLSPRTIVIDNDVPDGVALANSADIAEGHEGDNDGDSEVHAFFTPDGYLIAPNF